MGEVRRSGWGKVAEGSSVAYRRTTGKNVNGGVVTEVGPLGLTIAGFRDKLWKIDFDNVEKLWSGKPTSQGEETAGRLRGKEPNLGRKKAADGASGAGTTGAARKARGSPPPFEPTNSSSLTGNSRAGYTPPAREYSRTYAPRNDAPPGDIRDIVKNEIRRSMDNEIHAMVVRTLRDKMDEFVPQMVRRECSGIVQDRLDETVPSLVRRECNTRGSGGRECKECAALGEKIRSIVTSVSENFTKVDNGFRDVDDRLCDLEKDES